MIPRWSQNVAYLLAHQIHDGGRAWLNCTRCKTRREVDLAALIIKMNPLYSLWERRPLCPTCKGAMFVNATWSNKGAFVIPLIGADAADLHAAWHREQRRLAGWKDG